MTVTDTVTVDEGCFEGHRCRLSIHKSADSVSVPLTGATDLRSKLCRALRLKCGGWSFLLCQSAPTFGNLAP